MNAEARLGPDMVYTHHASIQARWRTLAAGGYPARRTLIVCAHGAKPAAFPGRSARRVQVLPAHSGL